MKKLPNAILVLLVALLFSCQNQQNNKKIEVKSQVVETACGTCMFGLEGKSCELAVKIDGQAYFVDGAKLDDFGDPHGEGGLCENIKKAEVSGEIADGRFKATSFKMLPAEEVKQ
ncbi:MAG: DUF6370 family protein [Bacteroidales bacterium]